MIVEPTSFLDLLIALIPAAIAANSAMSRAAAKRASNTVPMARPTMAPPQ